MIVSLLFACAPPFEETRKDLAGFRLAAMGFEGTELRAAVWSGKAWHETAPTLTWTIDGEVVTEAPAPPFTADLHVENAAGEAEDGRLVVSEDAVVPTIAGFTRTVDGSDVSLELDASGGITRWMGSSGTFTETGPNAADWVADEDGTATLLALTLDGRGGNTWTWLDVTTGPTEPALAVDGRLLPTDGSGSGTGWFLATLSAADNSVGYLLTDVVADDGTGGEVVCGLDPFDVNALVDGRCGRDEAEGARVALHGEWISE